MNEDVVTLASEIWTKKASNKFYKTAIGWILAGIYISFGAIFSINTVAWLNGVVPFGIIKLLSGIAFSLGLILVMIAWAELFTGNALLWISFFNKKISFLEMIKNRGLIWLFNFVWAIIIILLLVIWWRESFGSWVIWDTVIKIGLHKLEYGFAQAFSLWILCNILVCLWVWLAWKWKTVTDKVLWIIFPITAFVAAGFEHSVANMFYLWYAYALKIFWLTNITGLEILNLKNIFIWNLLPVTLWNIVWGLVFVGFLYWAMERK